MDDLGTEAKGEAVGEARRAVVEDARALHLPARGDLRRGLEAGGDVLGEADGS